MSTLLEFLSEPNEEPTLHGGAVLRNYKPGPQDNFQTPDKATRLLLPYLPKDAVIGEPACGKGNIVRFLRKQGFTVYPSDIAPQEGIPGFVQHDFLIKPRPAFFEKITFLATNVPFSLKDEFIYECLQMDIGFALIVPVTALEPTSVVKPGERIKMLQEFDWEVICPTTRICFETPTDAPSKPHKGMLWLTYGLGIGRQWTYVDMEKD
jgi:hypothetical protein